MKVIKILAIGNSFSVDATTYLHQFSLCGSKEIVIGNLHYGGCSLQQHFAFYQNDESPYEYYKNGKLVQYSYSLKQALKDEQWDYISLQQNSGNSGLIETFEPGIALYIKIRKLTDAKFVIHKTWAYASYYRDDQYRTYNYDQKRMHALIHDAYTQFAHTLKIKMIIPSADAFHLARQRFGDIFNRDGFHANEKGRYLLAALWYEFFTNEDARTVNFKAQGFSYDENSEQGPSLSESQKLCEIAHEVISSIT